eukprot:symbB.v1.2.008526.t1/scaffold527.1/size293072/24
MFQAQRIVDGKCRPVILHGYGGAKKEMPDSLAALSKFGWIPMAAAMVGTASSPPLWTGQDWRPILGTSVDTRILPPHLSSKESLLLLTPLTVGCLLTKSKLLLVLIVISHRIQLERCRNHHLWIQAVQDYFDDVPLCVPCCQLLRLVCETAPQQGCKVYLAPPDGSYHVGDLEALCRGSVPFPDSGVHVHIRPADAVVGSASGAGHVWAGQAHFYLHDGELSRLPSDETFIQMLQQNCCLSGPRFPPPAIVEALQDYVTHYYKVRRLHLIVVDLWRPWKYNTARGEITDQLWRISHGDDTHRVSPFRPDGPEPPLRCRRFAYGYALDGSECPSYLVWPQRDGQSYTLLDTSTTDTLPLNRDFFRPLGMEHFYDSFALVSQISVRREALHLFGLREDELLPDLHITRDGVLRIGLGAHQEHRVNHVARATDRTKVSADVIQLAADEVDTALCRKVMPVTLKGVKVRGRRKETTQQWLARVAAYPKPPKQRKPSASGTSFSDWIGGTCYADTLQVWFPAHWAPVVLQQLQQKEDNYRAENPSWMDQEVAPADIRKQWQEARANRRMQFKVGNYRDGVIAGVFRQKGAAPWGITRAEKLQLSVLLPNDLSLEDWYAGVYGLPTVWPEASMLGADNLRKVAGYDFHLLRKKYDVRTMWGDLDPQWRLLQSQLETRGPGWYSPAELKERLFTNKSKRPGDDTKEALRTDGNTIAWQAWDTARNIIWQSCQPGPPIVFPGEKEIFRAMYAQIGEEEQVISPPYILALRLMHL